MSGTGLRWLEKLDDLVREQVSDGNEITDTPCENGDIQRGPDDSDGNIGLRAFARHLEPSQLTGNTAPSDSLSPRGDQVEANVGYESFVAQTSTTTTLAAGDSPVAPPIVLHDSMLLKSTVDKSKEKYHPSALVDRCPVPPLFMETPSNPDEETEQKALIAPTDGAVATQTREHPLDLNPERESDAGTPEPAIGIPRCQRSGEVTHETPGPVSTLDVEEEHVGHVLPPQTESQDMSVQVDEETTDSPPSQTEEPMHDYSEHANELTSTQNETTEESIGEASVSGSLPLEDRATAMVEQFNNGERREKDARDLSDRSIEISVTHSLDDESEDFEIETPLPPWEIDTDTPFDPSLNCHGVVHVRIHRAQRLPCSIGSSIFAVVALPPWKGKILTERTNAYRGPPANGVCVRWDHLDEVGCSSMVHPWNSEFTPIPNIHIDLMFHFLQVELKIGSLSLNCKPLMRLPGSWVKRWMPVEVQQDKSPRRDSISVDENTPLVLIDAMFMPSSLEDDISIPDEIPEDAEINVRLQDEGISQLASSSYDDPSLSPRERTVSRVSTFSRSSQMTLRPPKKFHHLRVHTYWTPATCSVCSAVVTGWKRGRRCEVCGIDCCTNCQLQVDVQIPCGSGAAEAAVENAIQNKFEINKLLHMVAPVHPSLEGTKTIDNLPTFSGKAVDFRSVQSKKHEAFFSVSPEEGIGLLKLNIVRACLFDRPLSPDVEPREIFTDEDARSLRRSDHYVRISWTGSKESTRTRTIQNTGRPHFDTDEMRFVVAHYGMEYRIEVIDATSDKPIGSTLLTTQGLLQLQRDMLIDKEGIVGSVKGWNGSVGKRRTFLELRSGLKSGFGSDFFNASSVSKHTSSKSERKARVGEITGWIEIDVCLEEDMKRLYGPSPFSCPPPSPDDINVDMFQIHIARIGAIVGDIMEGFNSYLYLVSWKDPALTSLSLIIFVAVCIRFNSEYVGSLPLFTMIVYMLRLAAIRSRGDLKRRFSRKEKDSRIKAEKEVAVKYSMHRPIGRVEVVVYRGKNIRSKDLGLTGSVGCRVYWDPLRYQEKALKDQPVAYDKAVTRTHDVGFTGYQYAQNPIWDEMVESSEARRLKQLLPDEGTFFEPEKVTPNVASRTGTKSVHFPVLQPMAVVRKAKVADGNRAPEGSVRLEAWNASPGALVVQVNFRDVLSKLPGFDSTLGEVSVPISHLVESGEIRGWYHVLEVGTTELVPGDSSDTHSPIRAKGHDVVGEDDESKGIAEIPQVYLEMRWEAPNAEASDIDKEASVVVAEEMIRSVVNSRENKMDLIGSSIGAINTVWGLGGNVQFIQNTLGTILDAVEKVRNAFNFSDPFKSSVLLLILTVIWLFLAMVPTRALVLVAGLAQYVATFIAAYGPSSSPTKSDSESSSDSKNSEGAPVVTWLLNAFRSLPTDEDLRRAYFWESCRLGERESQIMATKKRESRLRRLWKAEWHGLVKTKVATSKRSYAGDSKRNWSWDPVFAIVQGRRFLWWHSVYDFDNGEIPVGRIFLAGHAGLAGLSPLDVRELYKDEIPLVANIFGRGMESQQKLAVLCETSQMKNELESAVIAASTKAD